MIHKGVFTSKRELANLVYDEAECLSKCHLSFYQCIDYYCEHKDVSFGSYIYSTLQYTIRNYERRSCGRINREFYYELPDDDNKAFIVKDYYSNPERMMDYHESLEQLKRLNESARGVEKTIITSLLAGIDGKELYKLLPYDKKTIHNALYRIRKKLKNISQEE